MKALIEVEEAHNCSKCPACAGIYCGYRDVYTCMITGEKVEDKKENVLTKAPKWCPQIVEDKQ